MSKRTVWTALTVLPPGIGRETVLDFLHDHVAVVRLNPNNFDVQPCRAPHFATAEETTGAWYQITDRISYVPGIAGKVPYFGCFNNLHDGMQSHVYAPLGLEIRNRWTLGGHLPGEPHGSVEMGIGAPKDGLYLKEDVDMRCNFLATAFVKKELKTAHRHLVDRLIENAHVMEREHYNTRLYEKRTSEYSSTTSPTALSFDNEHLTAAGLMTPPSSSSQKHFVFGTPISEMDANKSATELPSQTEPAELEG